MARTRDILIVGGSGMLGRALCAAAAARGLDADAPGRETLDLTAPDLERRVEGLRPRVVINAAAYSDVTAAERDDQHDAVWRLNRDAPAALARACARCDARLLHVSTDYVFDGRKGEPYVEDDPVHPLQAYGASKAAGEAAVRAALPEALIARVSTLFGPGPRARPHYVDAILAQARRAPRLEVVRLPVASPTYTPDAAEALLDLLACGARGTVHVVNSGRCSRLELARATVAAAGLADRVDVVERAAGAGGPARPDWSVLDSSRLAALLGSPLRGWRAAVAEYVETHG